MKIVIDTNIVFSALLSNNSKIKILLLKDKQNEYYTCYSLFTEIFKNKERLCKISSLNLNDLLKQMLIIFPKINLVPEEAIPKSIYKKAYNYCKDVDESDTPFVATAVFLRAKFLTGDKKLTKHLVSNGFTDVITVNEIINKESS
jgi:putative PIN family toxin of toxin-antitoxin system